MPFHGRTITRRRPPQLSTGEMSICENFRNFYPGIRKRGGLVALHTVSLNLVSDEICTLGYLADPVDWPDVAIQRLGSDWVTARNNGPGVAYFNNPDSCDNAIQISSEPGLFAQVGRVLVPFDLSPFTGSGIQGGIIKFWMGFDIVDVFGPPPPYYDARLCLVSSPLNYSVPFSYLDTDMDVFGTLISDDIAAPSGPVGEEISFTLNPDGVQFFNDVINLVYGPSRIATLFLMEYDHDYLDIEPPPNSIYAYAPYQGCPPNHPDEGLCYPNTMPIADILIEGDNYPISNYQFVKSEEENPDIDDYEKYTFLQMKSGALILAENEPPVQTIGAFGDTFFNSGESVPMPASYSDIAGIMLFSDWVNQHHMWAGKRQRIKDAFFDTGTFSSNVDFYKKGINIWDKVVENNNVSASILAIDSGDYGIFICCQTPATILNFIIDNPQVTATGLKIKYWRGYFLGFFDATITTDTTNVFGNDGSIEFSTSGEVPANFGGIPGFWYRIVPDSGSFSAFSIFNISYGNQEFIQLTHNVWDGIPRIPEEVQVYIDAEDKYFTYPAGTVFIGEMVNDDRIYIGTFERVESFIVDPGESANDNVSNPATIDAVKFWDGTAFSNATYNDGSNGFSKRGQLNIWNADSAEKVRFNDSDITLYWYEISIDVAPELQDSVQISIEYVPLLKDVEAEIGAVGISNAAFKDRAAYAFSRYPSFVYISSTLGPNVLNGTDFSVLQAGDGRPNKIVSMKKFHNELLVHQEERGKDGGCTTLFEGYSPATFGRLVLSTRIGALNEDAVVVIDGADAAVIRTDETAQTRAYWISRYGIYMSDGRIVKRISDPIQNYFDPRYPECLRKGYENLAWAAYDSSAEVVRFGFVSGDEAELPNIFPVYDLTTGDFLFDKYVSESNYPMTFGEVDAGSGDNPVIQIHYGQEFACIANRGLADRDDAIISKCRIEMNEAAALLELNEVWLRCSVEEGGELFFRIYEDGVIYPEHSELISLEAEEAGDDVRRERFIKKAHEESHLSLELENNQIDIDLWLYDLNFELFILGNR